MMKKVLALGVLGVVLCLSGPGLSWAGIVPVPEIDPGSAAAGLSLAIGSAALILERRRRR